MTNVVTSRDIIQEKGKQGSSYILHNLPKLFLRRMSCFFWRFFQTVGLILAWEVLLDGESCTVRFSFVPVSCQFRENVLCCCYKDICSNVITYSK